MGNRKFEPQATANHMSHALATRRRLSIHSIPFSGFMYHHLQLNPYKCTCTSSDTTTNPSPLSSSNKVHGMFQLVVYVLEMFLEKVKAPVLILGMGRSGIKVLVSNVFIEMKLGTAAHKLARERPSIKLCWRKVWGTYICI